MSTKEKKTKVLLYCLDNVGKSMAGPAVRYWEFAHSLSKKHDVILSVPNKPDINSDKFTILPRDSVFSLEHLSNVDVVIIQELFTRFILKAKQQGIHIILDGYTPCLLEHLEIFRKLPLQEQQRRNSHILRLTNLGMTIADAVICASDRQKHLWTGSLISLGRLTPEKYLKDPSLKTLIDVVPFGFPDKPPQTAGSGLRALFNIPKEGKVLLWGGGIWNWFDPLTLLRAVKQLVDENFPVYLVFMGVKHPNDHISQDANNMKRAKETQEMAETLGLINKHVFFNYGWTPYEQRQSFLLEADLGVSTHFQHLETQYSFRTRILDYIWAKLPIIATEGDSFAELIEKHQLGITVPYENQQALSSAIRKVLEEEETKKAMQNNLERIGRQFHWDEVVKPIEHMISFFEKEPKPKLDLRTMQLTGQFFLHHKIHQLRGVKEKLLGKI